MYLNFSVQKLEKFSANTDIAHFEGLVHILRYITDNKTLSLKYYANTTYAPVSDLLRQASIKTKNQLMDFSHSRWQDCPDTSISTGAYIIFYQGGPIYHGTYVPGPVAQSGAESEYNSACTAGMALEHLKMTINELLNNDTDKVPEEDPLIILDNKSYMCMANNVVDTKQTRHIARRMYSVRNGEKCKIQKIDWCEGGLILADIAIKNVFENDLTPRMKYIMVRLDN